MAAENYPSARIVSVNGGYIVELKSAAWETTHVTADMDNAISIARRFLLDCEISEPFVKGDAELGDNREPAEP